MFTFFGLMHSAQIGVAQSPMIAVAYLIVAGLMLVAEHVARARREPAEQAEAGMEPVGPVVASE